VSERVFLGLGANIGNREANLRMALRLIGRECVIVSVSSLYESPALVASGAPAGPDFLNAVCEVAAEAGVEELLVYIKQIEWAIGRRPAAQWSPRPIDIDLLLYGDRTIDMEAIRVPHLRICERAFVLERPADVHERGHLLVLDVETGRLLADERMSAPAQRFTLPLVVGDVVVVNSCDSDEGPGRLEGWRVQSSIPE